MSTTAKHTPGPWRTFFNQPDESGAVTCSIYAEPDMSNPHRGYVADVYRNHVGSFIVDEEFRANARLIAAAPDLLEVARKAEQLASIARDWNLYEVEIDGQMVSIYDLRDQFLAAISKAGGRS